MIEDEIEFLKNKIEELETKVNNLTLDSTYAKAMEISRARQLEDSVINRTVLNEILKALENNIVTYQKLSVSNGTAGIIKEAVVKGRFEEIIQMLKEGKKINAIKIVREFTNLGLKEAKDFIDSITITPDT